MIYIHVPFCKSRCLYCDFFSSTELDLRGAYVDALCREMDNRNDEILHARAQTLYIGGGTPSQLGIDNLRRIFRHLAETVRLENGAEVTLEVNPDDVTPEFAGALHDTPVNRVSMGVQTLDDGLLRLLGRRHAAAQAMKAVGLLREAGFCNLSLDLMYGLPGQTMDMWKKDVDTLLSLGIPHLSAYSLQWEEGTRLYRLLEKGEVQEADEKLSLSMYRYLMDATRNAGMHHYEISNFALYGYEARHNSGYWRDDAYVGLGPGAHSYDGKRLRSWNVSSLKEYIMPDYHHDSPDRRELLTDTDLYNERVMKRLRTDQGLSLAELSEDEHVHALKMAASHINGGRMVLLDDCLRLTSVGIFTSNDIMSDLML